MNLMRNILNGVWMMDESDVQSLLPIVNRFLAGDKVDFSMLVSHESPYGIKGSTDEKEKAVAVIPIKSVILKYNGGECGEIMGMMRFERLLNDLAQDDSYGAVVLDIDSGGGEASYMPHVAQAIRNFKSEKPILTHFSGVCASAAYYIASQTNKIYASLGTDIVGSVGTMCSLRRINTENKNAEFIYESIYATKSTEKNFEFEQIKEGNPAPMRENILDPMNEQFHADVLLGRPNINKEIFTGKAMLASSAIKFNMIDGIKRLDEVIAEAYSLIK